jgi:2-amino-4-hydroxy-6-hydroxymethyldihydropteridine diphosphokinase
MVRCLIALGGNLGGSELLFQRAIEQLDADGDRVLAVSRNFETRAVGEQAGGGFLNAAAVLESAAGPWQLLQRLQAVESVCGRERMLRWGPRTLDLDLLLFGESEQWECGLILPHPAMWLRRFVLSSAVEVAGDMWHPRLGQSIDQLWQQLCVPQFAVGVELSGELAESADFAGFLEQPLQHGAVSFQRSVAAVGVAVNCFARLQLRRADLRNPPWSYPEAYPGDRTLVLFVRSPENALEQLRQTATAITG